MGLTNLEKCGIKTILCDKKKFLFKGGAMVNVFLPFFQVFDRLFEPLFHNI